jgi:hypothetical protein
VPRFAGSEQLPLLDQRARLIKGETRHQAITAPESAVSLRWRATVDDHDLVVRRSTTDELDPAVVLVRPAQGRCVVADHRELTIEASVAQRCGRTQPASDMPTMTMRRSIGAHHSSIESASLGPRVSDATSSPLRSPWSGLVLLPLCRLFLFLLVLLLAFFLVFLAPLVSHCLLLVGHYASWQRGSAQTIGWAFFTSFRAATAAAATIHRGGSSAGVAHDGLISRSRATRCRSTRCRASR